MWTSIHKFTNWTWLYKYTINLALLQYMHVLLCQTSCPMDGSIWDYSILLAQLMPTLIHYPFAVPLPDLVFWSELCQSCKFTTAWDNGSYEGHYMEDMGLKFSPVIARHLLSLSKHVWAYMAGTSWAHSYSPNSINRGFSPPPAVPIPHHPPQ